MNKTNLGDKYTHRTTVRLSEEQFRWLVNVSKILGVTPSDYLRMTVNSGMVATKGINEIAEKGEGGHDENVKTGQHDQL